VLSNDLVLLEMEKVLGDNVHITCTHPGFLMTELHRGQGLFFDIVERLVFAIAGSSEYDSGRRLTSVLASENMLVKKLSYFDHNLKGRSKSQELLNYSIKQSDWLIKFLDDHIEKHRNK